MISDYETCRYVLINATKDQGLDGLALDAILTLVQVDGEEITDGEILSEIESILSIWKEKTRETQQ